MYSDSVNALKTDITFADVFADEIENVNFNSVWKGVASEQLLISLKDTLKAIEILKKQIDMYTSSLELMNEYIEVVNQISVLRQQLNAIVDDDRKSEHARAMLMARIARLEARRDELKGKINSILSSITVNTPVCDLEDVNLVDTSSEDVNLTSVDRYIEVINEIAVLREQYNNVIGDDLEDQQERGKRNGKELYNNIQGWKSSKSTFW